MSPPKNIKIVLMGNTGTGKTSLITSFLYGHPVVPKKPILFGAFYKEIEVQETQYKLSLCDTSGSKELIKLQEMTFLDADLLVVCTALNDKTGLKSAEMYAESCAKAKVPILLCLTKADLGSAITRQEIEDFVEHHKLNGIVQCSANDSQSVRQAIERMIEYANLGIVLERGYCRRVFRCC
ncbi:small GTP-binding protein domain protein [Vittaforma corneae ATCC 50505]|uniref:Small GTP-binding protein domain protein n=1 Tax=Vittaforma corneae (strain ATCC 50505) TaxID=993615 RepID=L2GL67_VITCO|nr:small GTP-binding protein domain protein [Vittaforma corneae ATCC 50505]ELA41047.1 small GTP-binding protein domain protein [Vittaforma corneae ATCC 50505]